MAIKNHHTGGFLFLEYLFRLSSSQINIINKMDQEFNNYAFIDSQNLEQSIKRSGWIIDMQRFRVYLKDKYAVSKAYMFIGYIENNQELYKRLEEHGYILIFRPTLYFKRGLIKGNCDAELVLHSMIEYQNYDKAVIVSGDGDFYCLVKYLVENNKLESVLIPNRLQFSALLKVAIFNTYLRFMNDLENKLKYAKEKTP